MKRSVTSLLICAVTANCAVLQAADYSTFAALSPKEKDRIVWQLHDKDEWGSPEQKPICRDILVHQGYPFANAVAWTNRAIDLAERQGWSDLDTLIQNIYDAPRNIWVYERAFRYLRKKENKPISTDLIDDARILRRAGGSRSPVTDEELDKAKDRLTQNPDKTAVLVYVLGVACQHAGKGGTDRGRKAAVEILQKLRHEDVVSRVRQLYRDGEDYNRSRIKWVADELQVQLQQQQQSSN